MEKPEFASSEHARGEWGLEVPALGLSLGGAHGYQQVETHRSWVDHAEELGLHSVWLPEMHFANGVCPAPLIELAGFAAATRRLRLGTTSLLLPLHPPARIAAEIAALDRISQGRLLIGLGRGFQRPMLEAFGVDPADKRNRFDAALDRILEIWDAGHAAQDEKAPWQRPHPPLAVAAFGPKGLAQAARRSLPYLASPMEGMDQIEENQRIHRQGLPDPSIRPLCLIMRTVFVSNDAAALEVARTSVKREMELRGSRMRMPAALDKAMSAPIEDRTVIGTEAEVVDRLVSDRQRLGIDLLIVRPQLSGVDARSSQESLRCLAERIWPEVLARRSDR